jgi:hypothetical protein
MRTAARGRFAEHPYASFAEVANGGVQVLDVQGDVVAAVITVEGHFGALIGRGVLEDLEYWYASAAEEPDLLGDGARMHIEVGAHPVTVVRERPKRVEVLESQDIDEERRRLVDVRHG